MNYCKEMDRNSYVAEVNEALTFFSNAVANLGRHYGKKDSQKTLKKDLDGLCATMPTFQQQNDLQEKCCQQFADMYLSGKVSKGTMNFFRLRQAEFESKARGLEAVRV